MHAVCTPLLSMPGASAATPAAAAATAAAPGLLQGLHKVLHILEAAQTVRKSCNARNRRKRRS
jgi:hypothetical protein